MKEGQENSSFHFIGQTDLESPDTNPRFDFTGRAGGGRQDTDSQFHTNLRFDFTGWTRGETQDTEVQFDTIGQEEGVSRRGNPHFDFIGRNRDSMPPPNLEVEALKNVNQNGYSNRNPMPQPSPEVGNPLPQKAEAENASLREQVRELQQELALVRKELELARQQEDVRIVAEDLVDKDSVIEDLTIQLEDKETEIQNLRQQASIAQKQATDIGELQEQQARNRQLQDELEGMEAQYYMLLEAHQQLQSQQGQLQEECEKLRPIAGEITNCEETKRRLEAIRADKGEALEELQQLKAKFCQDMQYLNFYLQQWEGKLDKWKRLRQNAQKQEELLESFLTEGIQKAYLFKGSDLVSQLQQRQQDLLGQMGQINAILEQLTELAEDGGFPEGFPEDSYRGTEELKQEAKKVLGQYEKQIRNVYEVYHKIYDIKNTITFQQMV